VIQDATLSLLVQGIPPPIRQETRKPRREGEGGDMGKEGR